MPERWDDVRVTVVRPGQVDQRGVCANSIPQDDFKATSLPQGKPRKHQPVHRPPHGGLRLGGRDPTQERPNILSLDGKQN